MPLGMSIDRRAAPRGPSVLQGRRVLHGGCRCNLITVACGREFLLVSVYQPV